MEPVQVRAMPPVFRLRSLHNAAKSIGRLTEEQAVVRMTLQCVRQSMEVSEAAILVSPDDYGTEAIGTIRGEDGAESGFFALPIGHLDTHCIVHSRRAITVADLGVDPASHPLREWSFAPLEIGGSITGLIGINRPADSLQEVDLELFCGLTSVTAVAIEQCRQRRKAIEEESRRAVLSRYFSPQVCNMLISRGATESIPTRLNATVMFADIRSFTALSENRDPAEVLDILNHYFTHSMDIVFKHGGMVDKLLGDGLLAVFGAPAPLPNHAQAALNCALEMVHRIRLLNFQQFGFGHLQVGIGIHTGPVVAGDLGGGSFRDYTVIGSTVNLASRIEALTKTYNAAILASEDVVRCVDDRIPMEDLGQIAIRGLEKPVVLYRIRI